MTYVVDVLCVAVPFDSVFEIEVIQIQLLDHSLPWPVLGCCPQEINRVQIQFWGNRTTSILCVNASENRLFRQFLGAKRRKVPNSTSALYRLRSYPSADFEPFRPRIPQKVRVAKCVEKNKSVSSERSWPICLFAVKLN